MSKALVTHFSRSASGLRKQKEIKKRKEKEKGAVGRSKVREFG